MANFTKTFSVPGKTANEIYTAIDQGIEHFLGKTPLGKVDLARDAASNKVSFTSSMANGDLTAVDGGLQVNISLSFLASAFKGRIEEGVSKWISKTFIA